MDKDLIYKWLCDSSSLGEREALMLQEVVDSYPYAQSIRFLYLEALMNYDTELFMSELKRAALFVSDRKILFTLLEKLERGRDLLKGAEPIRDVQEHASGELLKCDTAQVDKTLDVIDSFLSTLPEEDVDFATLEVSSDYMGYLFEDNEIAKGEKPLNGQHLIDDFLEGKSKNIKSSPIVQDKKVANSNVLADVPGGSEEVENEDDGFFTETLAKIYIKQKRYGKALEILKKITLKYPNKNAYFADQIRFLEKLIINTKSK